MNSRNKLLITIFGGWLGLHKFIDKKIVMGIIYLYTGGLFMIGWCYDIYNAYKNYKQDLKNQTNTDNKLNTHETDFKKILSNTKFPKIEKNTISVTTENVVKYNILSKLFSAYYQTNDIDFYGGSTAKEIKENIDEVYKYDTEIKCDLEFDREKQCYYVCIEDEKYENVRIAIINEDDSKKLREIINNNSFIKEYCFIDDGEAKIYDDYSDKIISLKEKDYKVIFEMSYHVGKTSELEVAGTSYSNEDETSRNQIIETCVSNKKFNVSFTPYKYENDNAIKIVTEYGVIGNVLKKDFWKIINKLDNIEQAFISNISLKNNKYYIKIYVKFK